MQTTPHALIEANRLTKKFGEKLAVDDASFKVQGGEIFGFLGPNGAGKSTFLKIMTGLLFATSGTARILGKPLNDISVRKRIGFLPENFKYGEWMTGEDLLSFHASLYKLDKSTVKERIKEVLSLVKLTVWLVTAIGSKTALTVTSVPGITNLLAVTVTSPLITSHCLNTYPLTGDAVSVIS